RGARFVVALSADRNPLSGAGPLDRARGGPARIRAHLPPALARNARPKALMSSHKVHVEFPGRILLVGFGSIGQGVLPLILRHIGLPPERVTIVTADERGRAVAAEFGVKLVCETLTRESFRRILNPLLGRGDFLLN